MNENHVEEDPAILFGRELAHPPPGEEVCITGISGVFPNSKDVHHFRDNLMQKIDMVDGDFRRWTPMHAEIPQRTGKIYDLQKFDPGFFGIHHRQTKTLDPNIRIFLEKAIEAVLDAGLHPSELEGTKTGVFTGICFAESEKEIFYEFLDPQMFGLTGCMRSMIANRLSYFLKLKGPSVVVDTACSSSLYALENAYTAIRMGLCDMAIVGGANLCLHPFVSLQFARLGVLSMDGCCKSFDAYGNGYCRSESINCVFLQRAKDARRIYSTVVHAKTGCDGYKEQGITYPSGEMQKKLLEEFYLECGVSPSSLSFLEAHGTGTKVGDPEEVMAIDTVFSPTLEKPLLIGSVKSNIGHSEPASGLCSVIKCIIGMEENTIPPNIHFTKPREGIKSLEEGRIKVVAEKTPFQDDHVLIGINSFGFGGGNCHILLKWNEKNKENGGEPIDDLPRLMCVSARTQSGVAKLIDQTSEKKLDAEYIQLLHEIFKMNIEGHLFRGYSIASKTANLAFSSRYYGGDKPPLILAFGHFGDDWRYFAKGLIQIAIFRETFERIKEVLLKQGLNFTDVINNSETVQTPDVMNDMIGTVAVQIGIINILKQLNIEPTNIIGYAIGEISCAYFDGCLTLEEAILTAHEIGKLLPRSKDTSSIVVLKTCRTKKEEQIPPDVEIIWRNAGDTVTITGQTKSIQDYVKTAEQSGAQTLVDLGAYKTILYSTKHYSTVSAILPKIKKNVQKKNVKTEKWISILPEKTDFPESLLKALYTPVTHEYLPNIGNHILVEIGTGMFSELLKISVPRPEKVLKFMKMETCDPADAVLAVLKMFGELYEYGYNPQIQHLYPKIPYPVSRGTPMISPKIEWNHSKDWYVLTYKEIQGLKSGERFLAISPTEEDWQFASGHVIDGRNLFPATGYLHIVWDTLSIIKNLTLLDTKVVFEDCRFKRATTITKDLIEFDIMIQRKTGLFEITEGGSDIVTGRVHFTSSDEGKHMSNLNTPPKFGEHDAIPLKTKDIYKELRLRGYNYKGAFRGVMECNHDATVAKVKWDGNWISFMDNMLQLLILQIDTRLLYVPIAIKRMTIDAPFHMKYVESFGEDPCLPVYAWKEAGIIRCGGIEIRGLLASSIQRRKQRETPVLEKYEFVPNEAKLSIVESLRVNIQIGLENLAGLKIKVVEVIDEATPKESEPLGPLVYDAFADLPLIQANISIFCKETLELPNVTVENKELRTENDIHLIIASKVFQRAMMMQQAFSALKEHAFIISREAADFDFHQVSPEDLAAVNIFTIHDIGDEKLIYFRKAEATKEYTTIKVSEQDEEIRWLSLLQAALKNDKHIILYAQNEELNGLLGLFNCLKREQGGSKITCVLIWDKMAPEFDPSHPFYENQLEKNMSLNIYKSGTWGTYRHLLIDESEEIETEHCLINSKTRGDLSSIRWIEGQLTTETVLPMEKSIIQVYYASLNFRDVMTAAGRINADVITMDRLQQQCVEGFEFSGRDLSGKRVMGMVVAGALSSLLVADNYLLLDVPDDWTLEQAATIPVVYGTVVYALGQIGKIRRGHSVLIHSGTGGVGQAAINFALAQGCTVFTTVGTPEKREFIKNMFPQINDSHIGNSRDTTFEKMIKEQTNGRGVDLVLNSLSENKLLASINCLAWGGKFLEIGKFDLANNNTLHLRMLEKECSFHGIMLDQFFTAHPSLRRSLNETLKQGLKDGFIKPLNTTVFKMNEVEQAFRHMTSGKHTGKVMIRIREEEKEKLTKPSITKYKALPRFACDSEKSYIIIGGLGGFGLELTDWLILRGARRILLTSRVGVQNGYQFYRLNIWKSYGAICEISTADITTREGCEEIITQAEKLGPIQSIFNLAVVLRDNLIENQSPESFRISIGPKATATKLLDEITRRRCPNLRDFVVFSSLSCGRGNPGQTNYGMANSVMERICEKRKLEGYPAVAIEWGAIGDVGLVAEMMEEHTEMEIGGTLQQRITSCLNVLDVFLRQKTSPVVSSMVVAVKKSGIGGADNIVDAVANILGIKKQSVSPHTSLSELGMDSMTAVEIKQVLEREYEVFLTAQDIRSLTFARLQEIQDTKEKDRESGKITERVPRGFELILRYLGDEATSTIPVLRLPSLIEDDSPDVPYIFCFPGIEGFATSLKPLVANIKARVIGIQFCYKNPTNDYKTLALESVEQIEKYVSASESVHIITYSWGTIIGLEAMSLLERKGYLGTVTCIDGAPDMLTEMCEREMKTGSEAEFETVILCHLMAFYLPYEIILKNRENLYKCNTFEERLLVAHKVSANDATHSPQYQKKVAVGFHTRLKELRTYEPDYPKIQSVVRLFKPSTLSVQNMADDYNLSRLCSNNVEVRLFEGNHITILENPIVAEAINQALGFTPKTQETTLQTKDH